MPAGLRRFQQAESLHFITFSCFHRLPYLTADPARQYVERTLEMMRARHSVRLYAYVLMPEHVHLLVNESPGILLGQWLKALKQTTSRELKQGREHFWQARYFDRNVTGDDMFDVIRYIHRNPLKRGLAETPEAYRWSSFRHYAFGERGVVEIESEWTARWRQTHSSR